MATRFWSWFRARLDSTYEGLKRLRSSTGSPPSRGLDSTYEGLKHTLSTVATELGEGLDSTYEGLKRRDTDTSVDPLRWFGQYL